ncbi:MAG: NAD(P)H-binding protein [Phycisphaerales bacterium]
MAGERIVAVAGASGFVGRHVVAELLSRGYAVRALVRSREKARAALPRDDRVRLVVGGPEPRTLALLAEGAAGIVNTVGIIREAGGNTFRTAHVLTTRALVEAARGAGVERFVQVSALGVSAEGKTAYQQTKFEAEQVVRRSGLLWTILRPGLIHGPGNELMRTAKGWVTGAAQPWFFLPYFTRGEIRDEVPLAAVHRVPGTVQPVAVEDVAWAAAESLERPAAAGEVFNLVGPEVLTWPQLLDLMQEAIPGADVALRPLGIPGEFASVQAKLARKLGLGGLLPFDEGMPIMAAEESTASPEKARQMLGLEPRPFTPALREYAGRI